MAYINPDVLNNLYKDFIGVSRLADQLNYFYEGKSSAAGSQTFPPYNIIEVEPDQFMIQLAIAGYDKSDITIEVKDNQLIVSGKKEDKRDAHVNKKWIWNGIASRNFERKFMLSENIVIGSADYTNGILSISMERIVPEERKPKMIAIR